MPLYAYNGQLFQVGGELAANQNCCCENVCIICSCLPSTVSVAYPSWQPYVYDDCSGCGGSNNGRITVPSNTVTAYLCCVDDSYVVYRANAVYLGTVSECCGGSCITRDAWLTVAIGAICDGSPLSFSGWQLSLKVVLSNYNTSSCTSCVTSLSARSISTTPCSGISSSLDISDPESFFTCSNTCTPSGCVFWQLEYTASSNIYSVDSCTPTGSFTATIPGFEDIGTVTVS